MNKSLFAAAAMLLSVSAQAAIGLGSPAATYSQNFDTLASTAGAWANDSTLAGWSLFNRNGAAITALAAGTGSSNAGSFYSFGAAGNSERALGGVASGGAYFGSPAAGALAGTMAVAFSNDTGSALAGFTLGFDGEQWRDGGSATPAAQTMSLQYGFGSDFATVTWQTPGGSFNFSSPVFTNTGSGAAVDGNTAGLVAGLGGSISTLWAPGETLWVRWIEDNNFGNDHGLAIDNLSFSVTAVPEPGTTGLLLAGLAVVGLLARRRA